MRPCAWRLGDAGHDAGELRIARLGQSHARKRIVFVRIESSGDDHQLRLELLGRRHQHLLKDGAILVVALSRFHRHIDREAFPCATAPLRLAARAWIMWILMRAEKEDGGIVFETMLRAIAVMHVPIDNQHTGEAMLLLGIACGNRDIIQQTKPHRAIGFGMMSRRPHCAENMINLLRHHRIDRGQRPSGCQIGSGQRTGRHGRIGIERHAPVRRRMLLQRSQDRPPYESG